MYLFLISHLKHSYVNLWQIQLHSFMLFAYKIVFETSVSPGGIYDITTVGSAVLSVH